MVDLGVAIDVVSIFARGVYNPAVFSPRWFRDQDLISASDLAKSKIELITQDLSIFEIDWITFQADRDSFAISTDKPEELGRLRDAAVGLLRSLPGTPIGAIGLNRGFHVVVDSEEAMHRIGDIITPKQIWEQSFGKTLLRSVTMMIDRENNYSGHMQLTVEPSARLGNAVYIGTNDHYTLEPSVGETFGSITSTVETTAEKTNIAVEVLEHEWGSSLKRSESAKDTVMGFEHA